MDTMNDTQMNIIETLVRELEELKKTIQEERDTAIIGLSEFDGTQTNPYKTKIVKKNVTYLKIKTTLLPFELTQLPCLRTLDLQYESKYDTMLKQNFNIPQVTKLIMHDYQPAWRRFPNVEHLVFDFNETQFGERTPGTEQYWWHHDNLVLQLALHLHLHKPLKLKRIDMESYKPYWMCDMLQKFCDDNNIELCIKHRDRLYEPVPPSQVEAFNKDVDYFRSEIEKVSKKEVTPFEEDDVDFFQGHQINLLPYKSTILDPFANEVRIDE